MARPRSVQVRDMLPGDLSEVLAIERQVFDTPWTIDFFLSCVRDGSRCRLLEVDGKPGGYCILHQVRDRAEIYTLAVSPPLQGHGFGRLLLRDAISGARDGAASSVVLEVRPGNTRAVNLYESEGFTDLSRIADYFENSDGTTEDARVMSRRP
ncbi:MAG: ribosomal protein S18-alanine N-acetyltransferase [Sutterellaceae bacterium]|nr:ribosomal protein S18-alanine N-acetyltransferase [Sutterellaceae bacterium]MDD7442538.1 ribosomal protein S18-alanine N-acetyltransferase [Sutterellaceae bacterium]MDY2867927.1 ribosomal protein S18-alanine N-acetyltransferase [Mesosutterella sp.]